MKLKRIFSNKQFKNIEFKPGFNVVLAEISDKSKYKDTHNLGKTSLIHVIGFLLLDKFDQKKHLLGNQIFAGQVFFGEFLLNNGHYLVIRRSVDTPTKISFRLSDSPLESFIAPSSWDDEDVPFEKAVSHLNDILAFDVITEWSFRKYVTYYLRTQDDFLDVFQLAKYKGKHRDWKPVVFSLLGFNGDLIVKKADEEGLKDGYENKIETLKAEAQINPDDRDKLLGLIDIKTEERQAIDSHISRFDFYETDANINKDLVDNIDTQLQELNALRYALSYETDRIEKSLSSLHQEVTISELETLFEETNIYFSGQIKKDFSELLDFNRKVSTERMQYLKESLTVQRKELGTINDNIKTLENRKAELLSYLIEKDSYAKFKEYQKQLSLIEADLIVLQNKLEMVDKSVGHRKTIEDIEDRIKTISEQISDEINKRKHSEINKIFNSIIMKILNTNALISLRQNGEGNVEFSADFQKPVELLQTAEGKGHTYKKLLCMAFDLAIQIHYAKKSYFRFIYHDGILEGLDDRKKLNLIETIKDICREYNLQYIITLIDSDLPLQDGEIVQFSPDDICLRLHDRDDTGKLFLRSF